MVTNKEEPLSQPEMPRYLNANLSYADTEIDVKLKMNLVVLEIRLIDDEKVMRPTAKYLQTRAVFSTSLGVNYSNTAHPTMLG